MTGRSAVERLGDFTADMRILTLTVMAAIVGVVSAFAAFALLRLIGLFTHLFYDHTLATSLGSLAHRHVGPGAVIIPVAGGVIVGLMARFGSQQIRGHGIPEALRLARRAGIRSLGR